MADDNPIPRFCECGCGQPTNIAQCNVPARGYVKGQPKRFVKGHFPKKSLTYRRKSYVQRGRGPNKTLHRQRAENALGKPLPPGAEVHHPDEDPWNPNARLVICESASYHKLLHIRMRIQAAG